METSKFKLRVTRSIDEEKELALPFFRKNKNVAYKIISETLCIQADVYSFSSAISTCNPSLAWTLSTVEDCTEEEFVEMYNQAKAELDKLVL